MESSPDPGLGEYVLWKGWVSDKPFATLQRGDSAYYARELREALRLGAVERVLEVGFGNGEFLGFCRERGWQVSGTELQPELCTLAREAGFDAHEANRLDDLPRAEFDLVVALDVFEHIDPERSIAFLGSLATRLARRRAHPHAVPQRRLMVGNTFQNGDPTHVNAIGYLKLSYYAQAAGLDISVFRGATRRGFRTSVVHGIHAATAGVWISIAAKIRRAMYFPALPLVLSTSDVVCVLTKPDSATTE